MSATSLTGSVKKNSYVLLEVEADNRMIKSKIKDLKKIKKICNIPCSNEKDIKGRLLSPLIMLPSDYYFISLGRLYPGKGDRLALI